jgi:hypothetical protein
MYVPIKEAALTDLLALFNMLVLLLPSTAVAEMGLLVLGCRSDSSACVSCMGGAAGGKSNSACAKE